jgi:hypothetical protein
MGRTHAQNFFLTDTTSPACARAKEVKLDIRTDLAARLDKHHIPEHD